MNNTLQNIERLKNKMNPPKEIQVSREDMEELVYYSRNKKDREMEMQFWARLADEIRGRIMAKSGLDLAKYSIDWTRVFDTGRVYAIRIPEPPKPKATSNPNVVVTEEGKDNGKPNASGTPEKTKQTK